MKTKFAVVKYGHAHKDGSITDNERVFMSKNCDHCRDFINGDFENHYIEMYEFDGLEWLSVEGTEILN